MDGHLGGDDAAAALIDGVRRRDGQAIRVIKLLLATDPPEADRVAGSIGVDACVRTPIRQSELLEAMVSAADGRSRTKAGEPLGSRWAGKAAIPLNVLVVEDHPINQKIATATLGMRGHQVTVAENGREAIELHERQHFDVILMDVQMPEMDGPTATRAIREIEAGGSGHVRIIAVTASAHAGERERLLASGMDDYLAKPFLPASLVSLVEAPAATKDTSTSTSAAPVESSAVRHQEASGDPVFDRWSALARCLGDTKLLQRVAAAFISTEDGMRKRLHAAVETGDLKVVEEQAHRLKGALAMLSANAAAEAAANLEVGARAAEATQLRELMSRVDVEVDRLLAALTSA
jgi:CheY-like chemotaxis protein